MEAIILIVVLAVLFVMVAVKIPDVNKELSKQKNRSSDDDDAVKLNKFEASEEGNGKKKKIKKITREIPRFSKSKTGSSDKEDIQEILDRANDLVAKKEYEDAESLLIGKIEHYPKSAKIYNKLGIIYLEQENFADAKEAFKTALNYDKNNDLIYNNLGLALFNQGRYVEAIEAYSRSIQLNGLISHRYINLGLAHSALRQYDKALDVYKKAQVLDKDNKDYKKLIKEVQEKIAELKNME